MIPKAWRGRRSGFSLLVLAAGLLGALLGASPPAPVRDLDRRAFDLRLSLLPEVPAPLEVVLVLAREETLARMGRWPWPRRYHAALLDRLGEARTVVLDILFPEGGDPEDDALLARAAARHGRVVAAIHLAPGQGKAPPRILPPYDALFRGVADVGVTNVEADEEFARIRSHPPWGAHPGGGGRVRRPGKRPYKKGWPLAEVCDLLYKQSREDFDPDVVQAFWEMKAPEDWVPPDRRPQPEPPPS